MMSMTHVAEVVEIVGSSNKSWEDAVQVALNEAAKTAEFLIVGINSDASVKRLKGDQRPYYDQDTRALMIASLNIGTSSGLREVIRLPSSTTGLST